MNPISKKHHYIPRFLLKKFLNPNKRFAVYNSVYNTIQNGKTDKEVFYKINDNSIELPNGRLDDFFEKYPYGDMDNIDSIVLANTLKNFENKQLDYYDGIRIDLFLNRLFWRLPCNRDMLSQAIKEVSSLSRFWVLKDKSTGEVVSRLNEQNCDYFNLVTRVSIAEQQSFSLMNSENDFVWFIFYDNNINHMFSSNPFIFINEDETAIKNIFTEEYIIPLSSNHVLIKVSKKRGEIKIDTSLISFINIIEFLQCDLLCCCASENNLKILKQCKDAGKFDIDDAKFNLQKILNKNR